MWDGETCQMGKSPFKTIKLKLCTASSLPIARNCLDSHNKCINATQFATFLAHLHMLWNIGTCINAPKTCCWQVDVFSVHAQEVTQQRDLFNHFQSVHFKWVFFFLGSDVKCLRRKKFKDYCDSNPRQNQTNVYKKERRGNRSMKCKFHVFAIYDAPTI